MAKKNYAYINCEMLVWARSETPFVSTADVEAHDSGLKSEKIDLWESGKELPSIAEAKKLANLYKVPFASFFLSRPPEKKPKGYTDRRTYNGTIYREVSYELWSEISRVTSNREIMLEYADEEFEVHQLPLFDENATEREIADKMRDVLGLELPFKNKSVYKNAFSFFRGILEHYGIMVTQIAGVSLTEMKGLSISYDIFPIIAVNNKDFERAKVFSLFHELAHLVRRSSSLCLIDFDDRNDEEEKICDRIAAELLMPEISFRSVVKESYGICGAWSSTCLCAIGDRFAVSSVTVLRRLHELGIIPTLEYQSIYRKMNEEFEAEQEWIKEHTEEKNIPIKYYIRYLNKEGYLFPKTVVSAFNRGDISYGEMCRTLNVKGKHIENIERAVMFI